MASEPIFNISALIPMQRVLGVCETLAWFGLLTLIGIASFIFGGYGSQHWLQFSAVFYVWFCFSLTLAALGGRINWRAIRSARHVIILLLASMIWLYLPLIVPYKHALYDLLETRLVDGPAHLPTWFSPMISWSVSPNRTRWLLMSEVLISCIFISTLALVYNRQRLRQLLVLFMIIGLAHAAVGLFGKFANVLFVERLEVDGHFDVARGLFINRNHFAAFLVLTLLGGLAAQWRLLIKTPFNNVKEVMASHLRVRHLWVLFSIGLTLVACISSQSRGAVLSLVVGLVIAMVFTGTQELRNKRIILLPLVVFSVIAFVYFGQELLQRLSQDALSLGERWEQWQITFKAIRHNPLLGYGGGSYATVFQVFRDDDNLRQVVFAQSHNHYLHLWLERGVVGLAIWLTMIALIIKRAVKILRKSPSSLVRGVQFAAMVVMVAALTQSLVDFNLQILNIRAWFFIIIAITYASSHIKHTRQ